MALTVYGALEIIVKAEQESIDGPNEMALFTAFDEMAEDLKAFVDRYNRLHAEGGLTLEVQEKE